MKSACLYPGMIVVLVLVSILICSSNLFPYKGTNKQESLFYWAKKYYVDGIYRESVKKMTLLLSIMDKNNGDLSMQVHLLLGAAYENLKKNDSARKHYRLAKKISNKFKIEEIDLTSLVEYRRIFLNQPKSALGLAGQ